MILKLNGVEFQVLETPAITKQVNNIAELADRQSDKSSTFTLPFTAENAEKLELAQNVQSETRLPYGFFLAEMPKAGIYLGLAKLNRSSPAGYELNIFGGLINFFALIDNLTLNDLRLNDFDHKWNLNDVSNAFTRLSGYVYPFIDYGTFPQGQTLDIFFDNFRPSVYVDTIFKAIFEAQGWSYAGEIFKTDEWKKLIIPFSADEWSNSQRYADTFGINLFQPAGSLNISGSQPGGGVVQQYFDLLNFSQYTATATIQAEITGRATIDNWNLSPNVGAALQFVINGVIQPALTLINGSGSFEVSESIILNAGDVLNLAVVYGQPAGTNIAFNYSFDYLQGAVTTDFLESRINYGGVIHLESILPNVSQKDFIKNICQTYGLTIQADSVRKVLRFESWNYIYNNVDQSVNWSLKIDSNALNYTELNYKFGQYAQSNALKFAEDENVTGNFDGQILVNDLSLPSNTDLFELEFSGSEEVNRFVNLTPVNIAEVKRINQNQPPVGIQEYISVKPRILTVEPVNTSGFTIDTGNLDGVTQTFTAGEYLKGVFKNAVYPLNLDAVKNRFWGFLETSTLNKIKVLTLNAHLLESDITNLDHFKPVYLDQFDSYFYLNTVSEFTGSDDLTEINLIRL